MGEKMVKGTTLEIRVILQIATFYWMLAVSSALSALHVFKLHLFNV